MTERDMDAPVTRCELHDALDKWGGAMTAQMTAQSAQLERLIATAIAASEVRVLGAVKLLIEASEQRLMYELRSQTKSSEEALATQLVAVDDQYKDLPGRVTRLEAKVFAPPKRKRRAQRSR
jgi:hypothetical protein